MLVLVCIAGIVLGLIYRERAERPITVMIVSLGALVLIDTMNGAIEMIVYRLFAAARGGGGIISDLLGLWGWVASALRAAAIGGLAFAALDGRGFEIFNLTPPNQKSPGPPVSA